MKKILCSIFCLMIFMTANCYAAELPLRVVSDYFYFSDNYACYNALVVNDGDKELYVADGNLKFYNEYGTYMEKLEINAVTPAFLKPGEYIYYSGCPESTYFSVDQQPANITFELNDYRNQYKNTDNHVFRCDKAELVFDNWEYDQKRNYVDVTFTNRTNEVLSDYSFAIALFDENKNIIHVKKDGILFNNIKFLIPPNNTVILRIPFNSYNFSELQKENIVPVFADALIKYETH